MVDGFEINKILGAVLGTLLFVQALNMVAGGVFAPRIPEQPGYEIAVPEVDDAAPEQVQPKEEPIAVRLADASVERGESSAKKCIACHSFEKGGPNKVGPNLWGIVGASRAHEQGFAYSSAMQQEGGTWTFENLDSFLANPRAEIKGTSMVFAGIPRPGERADLIAYLNAQSDSPEPLPEPQKAEEPAQDEATPQDGGAAQNDTAPQDAPAQQ